MRTPRIVIIGAGIVGANIADELSLRGWTNITVVDQGPIPLTGGSTSHAPGLVFQTSPSQGLSETAQYTATKLLELTDNGEAAYNPVGGLEIATTEERLAELQRRHNFNTCWGVESHLIDAAEALRLHPLLDASRIQGALYVPSDGLASSVFAVEMLRRRAESRGVEFREKTTIVDVEHRHGRVTGVRTTDESLPADWVISAAGFWGPLIGDMVGVPIPLTPFAHQYALTTELSGLPAVAPHTRGTGANSALPILRLQEDGLYFRQVGSRLGIGSYHHRAIPVAHEDLPAPKVIDHQHMPSRMEFTTVDFATSWENSRRLLPSLRETQISEAFNGIFSFTPDGGALVGPAPGIDGLFIAEAIWVTHSAGIARAVAELMMTGHSSIDVRDMNISRFDEPMLQEDYVLTTSTQSFREVYDIVHPHQPRLVARPQRLSPFYDRQQDLGAYFQEASGWERPHWYEANAPLLEHLPAQWIPPQRDTWAARFYSPISAVEAHATRNRVAMYDMTSLRRMDIHGSGAQEFLNLLCTGSMNRPTGTVIYTLVLDQAGGILSDITVAKIRPDVFQVGLNSNIDVHYIIDQAQAYVAEHPDHTLTVIDTTPSTCCIGLWGPLAREVVGPLTDQDLTNEGLKYFQCCETTIAGIPVRLLRLSYVGELGWEIYTSTSQGAQLWDALWEAGQSYGLIAAGRGAFNSLRLEKGYRSWGSDMWARHFPDQAGLGFAVDQKKPAFLGQAALKTAAPSAQRLVCLTVDDGTTVLFGHEPVLIDGMPCGFTTSAEYGYSVHRPIALAWLPDHLRPGDQVQIRYFDQLVSATVVDEPLVDPQMQRVRA